MRDDHRKSATAFTRRFSGGAPDTTRRASCRGYNSDKVQVNIFLIVTPSSQLTMRAEVGPRGDWLLDYQDRGSCTHSTLLFTVPILPSVAG
jgi:hypothetical protein